VNFFRLNNPQFILLFISIWFGMLVMSPIAIEDIREYGVFSFIGVLGGIFAHSTGAGGGVVFIP
jgi:uncharacterized membrane protein YfcA